MEGKKQGKKHVMGELYPFLQSIIELHGLRQLKPVMEGRPST